MFPSYRRHTVFVHVVIMSSWVFFSLLLIGCGSGTNNAPPSVAATGTPGAQADVGERLFVETRFAQFFKTHLPPGGNVNDPLPAGDPVVANVLLPGSTPPGVASPFAGMSMNCRSCHFVDEFVGIPGGGLRTYTDFAVRSPIPSRPDGKLTAPRNSPPLVNASLSRPGGTLFHFDGEFSTIEDLIVGTFTGRNFGWLPGQKAEAISHIARIMREDDGSGAIAQQFDGLSYTALFTGANPNIPDELRLPPEFRVLIQSASDQEIFDAVVKVVAAYVNGLGFSQTDDAGNLIRSPFDVFLSRNGLPQQPNSGESPLDYSRRLLTLVNGLASPHFVTANPNNPSLLGKFQFHGTQPFVFGAQELAGLKIFLTEPAIPPTASPAEVLAGNVGNCLACHAAPNFTDFKLHNTGTAQKEYDDIHAPTNTFAGLFIPNLATRDTNYNLYLPATENHPNAQEPFRAIPTAGNPNLTDLGVWNVFANPDMPGPQAKIRAILCEEQPAPCTATDAVLLPTAIARFKTPGLRDLSHSAPYMHNGQFATLTDIINFYIDASNLARTGTLRNGAVQLQGIALATGDVASLVAFLKSLNEDYQ
ncbi:MAG TPA: hypothetical protein VJU02_07075 [Nitrospiraceae bacterium]|nr:hypothetical protein [Nitrospiraceae bacterium]